MPKHVCYYMLKSKTMSTIERRDNNYSKVPNQLNIDNGVLSKQCEDTFLNNGMRNKWDWHMLKPVHYIREHTFFLNWYSINQPISI